MSYIYILRLIPLYYSLCPEFLWLALCLSHIMISLITLKHSIGIFISISINLYIYSLENIYMYPRTGYSIHLFKSFYIDQ